MCMWVGEGVLLLICVCGWVVESVLLFICVCGQLGGWVFSVCVCECVSVCVGG